MRTYLPVFTSCLVFTSCAALLGGCSSSSSYTDDLTHDVFVVTQFGPDAEFGDSTDTDRSIDDVRALAARNGWIDCGSGRFAGIYHWSGGGGGSDDSIEVGESVAEVLVSEGDRGLHLELARPEDPAARSCNGNGNGNGNDIPFPTDVATDLALAATGERRPNGDTAIAVEVSNVDRRDAYGRSILVDLGPGVHLLGGDDLFVTQADGRLWLDSYSQSGQTLVDPLVVELVVRLDPGVGQSYVILTATSDQALPDPVPANDVVTITIQ